MSRLTWDVSGQKRYQTGIRQVVVYPQDNSGAYPTGYAWSGVTSVAENPSGADPTDLWADDVKYLTLRAAEDFAATIEAYDYPDEFAELDGSVEVIEGVYIYQQARKAFGMCYRTVLGNDIQLDGYGYKLHLLYGCTVSPSSQSFQTMNDSPDAISFSWEMTTIPVNVGEGYKPTARLVIDSTQVDSTKLGELEDILYGTDGENGATGTAPRLPLPDEVIQKLT